MLNEDHVDTEQYRDNIATVDKKGKRIWLNPKMPKGKFYDLRKYVSYALLIFLFGMPFIKVGGNPILLFNVLERKFIIFGLYFAPQDFHLFVFAMLTFIVFIALFTVVFGRLFCGWVCPQTIFMEMVYRRIEYWIEGDANAQKRLKKAPWTTDKIIKKTGKQILFFIIAVLVANTFLAYIIGIDQVWEIITEPISQHSTGFLAMIIFSFLFYFVFAWVREQVCVAICPYGRLQGVLLDKNSIAVYYDFERGEPRGKIRKTKKPKTQTKETQTAALNEVFPSLEHNKIASNGSMKTDAEEAPIKVLGDCIDCKLCIHVCPTGIDIRDGVQLECVNCTACMDACDEVMEKIGRPKELIRYDSYNGIVEKKKKIFTPRVMAYSFVLVALLVLQVVMLAGRSDVETLLLRTPGMLFQKTDDGQITNLYNYQIINKTDEEIPIEFKLSTDYGKIKMIGEMPLVGQAQVTEGAMFIELPPDKLQSRSTKVKVLIYSDGELIDEVKTKFLGPIK